jgi:phage shock protein E
LLSIKTIKMNQLIQLIKEKKATIIDVRSQLEFDQEHFPDALHIPLEKVQDEAINIGQMPKPIVVYCRSGNRSGMAAGILAQNGINEVYNGGGFYDMLHILNN